MKKAATIISLLISGLLIYQTYQLYSYYGDLSGILSVISDKLRLLKEENLNLQSDLNYFQEPENLEKELRSRFNYKKPGEKLIILVPAKDEQQ